MRRWIPIVGVAAIVAVAVAQPQGGAGGGPGGGGMGQRREMQMKALEAIQQAVAKLRTSMEAMMPSGGANFQDMSEEERTKFRDQMTQRRDEQAKIIADIESQLTMLKGRRQLQTEHEEAMAKLEAMQSQAKQENATKTADMIAKMIKEKQDKFDKMMEPMGGPPQQP